MQEIFEQIKQRVRIAATEAYGYAPMERVISETEVKGILEQVATEHNNGWIPVEKRLPEVPEGIEDAECPEFNVIIKGATAASTLRCDAEGNWFDDLGEVYNVIAWQPLPKAYFSNTCADTDGKTKLSDCKTCKCVECDNASCAWYRCEKNAPTEECHCSACEHYCNEEEDIEEGFLDGYGE